MRRFILLLFSSVIVSPAFAQDIHFSQFFNAPVTISPSNTGNFDGDWRVTANYRQQWKRIDGNPYVTQAIGFEKQFYLYTENLSGGLMVIQDKSAESLKVLKIQLSGGYHKRIGIHRLHGGITAGFVNKTINPNAETFPNQFNWDQGQFDNTIPNQEANLTDQLSYLDFNLGGGYNTKIKKWEPYLSLAAFHINTPKESFNNNAFRLKMRKVLNVGTIWQFKPKVALEPMVFLMGTTKASDLLVGGNVHYKLQSPNPYQKTSIYAGVFFRDGMDRNWDAFFLTGGIRFKEYTFGVSYDYNVSDLHTATDHRGAFELSFNYTALSTRLKKTIIPCDRY